MKMTLKSTDIKEQKKYAQVFIAVLSEMMQLRASDRLYPLTPADWIDSSAYSLINAVKALNP
jgi:hypothetical protein